MKKTLLTVVATAVILFLSMENVFTNAAQPQAGRTGAPGETSCAASGCHSGGANATNNIALLRGATTPLTEYTPGDTYNVIINVNQLISPSSTTPKNGFEVIALDASNNMAGSFNVTNTNQTVKLTSGAKEYVAHKNAASLVAWAFQWTAPTQGTGTVTFYVAANMSNNNGNTSGDNIYTQSFTVTEAAAPDPCENYEVSIAAPANEFSVCPGGTLELTGSANTIAGILTYNWSTGATTPGITVNAPGTYSVTVSDGTCTDSASVAVTTATAGSAAFNVTVVANNVTFNDLSTGSVVDYIWDYGDGNTSTTNGTHTYTYADTGSYTALLSTIDACGDTSINKLTIGITSINTGVKELWTEEVTVYPNPFAGNIHMDLAAAPAGIYTLRVVDLAGMTALSSDLNAGANHELPTADLPNGMYFYQLIDGTGNLVKSGRLLAQ